MCFLWSLVLSRLLFNAHVQVPTLRYVRTLSSVYMRAIRRVLTGPRFGPDDSDLTVRRRFKVPSLDCLLRRARMRFLGRIVTRQPPAMLSILGARHKGTATPWVDLVHDDLVHMRSSVALCAGLPPPCDAEAWYSFILEDPGRWANAVAAIHYVESIADAPAATPGPGCSAAASPVLPPFSLPRRWPRMRV